MQFLDREEFRQDVDDMEDDNRREIEFNDAEPDFLKGVSSKSKGHFKPVKTTQDEEGAMMKAAQNQSEFSKQRKDVKEAK